MPRADNVGGARNAIVATFRAIEERSEGANLNTFNAQLEQVRDQLFVLSAEIGRELLPALTGLLRNASQLVGGFRELNPSVKGLIGFTSLAAAGVTTLGLAASTLTVTVGFLNTSLISLTGVGGLAGFFAFLGPIAAGVGLVTAALAPLALLIARSAQESREAAAATRRFQDAISSANRAFQDQNGIKSQIQLLQQYIRTQEEFLSNQRQIFQRGRQSHQERGRSLPLSVTMRVSVQRGVVSI